MATGRLAHAKRVLRFICLMASVSAALGAGTANVANAQGSAQDKQAKDEALRRAFERQKLDRLETQTREAFKIAIKTNERLLQAAVSGSDAEKHKAKIAAGIANSNLERALAAQADADPEVKRAKAAAEAARSKSKTEYDKAFDTYIKAKNKLAERIKSDLEEGRSKEKQSQLVSPISSAAPGRSSTIAADGQGKRSFSERYQKAANSAWDLAWDIDEYAGCRDLDFVEDEVAESKVTLRGLIAEADRTGQGIAANALRDALADLSATFDDYKAYCGKNLLRLKVIFEGGVISQDVTGHVQRLAHDVNNIIAYDFANVDQKSSGSKFRLGLDIPVQRIGSFRYAVGLAYAYTSLTASASGSANGPFNAPGLGVGLNGNGFATGANTPVSYQYDSDSNRHLVDLSAVARTRVGSVYFSPRIGGNFGVYTVDDSYTFNRPSPPNLFAGSYTTSSTAYTVGGYLKMGIDYRLPQSKVTVFGAAKAGIDYNWAKSDVSFQLTSPLSDYQKVSISDTKFTPNLSLESGVKVNLGTWNAYLKGGIQYGRYVPNVSIPGGGLLPKLNGEKATEYSVMAGLRMDLSQFGKVPRRKQFYFSDMRLKRDIAQVGRLANGLKLYRYRYLWGDTVYVGVMAQEVALLMPRAVLRGPDGFLRVDYNRLGLRMMTWDEWLATGACAIFPTANSNCRLEDQAG